MKLRETLEKLQVPLSRDTLYAALLENNFEEAIPPSIGKRMDRGTVEAKEKHYERPSDTADTDLKYWQYLGWKAFWRASNCLHKAAALTGPDNLPEVPLPRHNGPVMDMIDELERFGVEVWTTALKYSQAESISKHQQL